MSMNHLCIVCLLLFSLVGCAAPPAPWEGPFTFLVMTDPQLGMTSGDKDTIAETELLTKAVALTNRARPAFLACCGDAVNKPLDEVQIAEFQRIVSKLDKDIPLHSVCGNHDVGNKPEGLDLERYRRTFGPDYYSFDVRGCHFIVINTEIMHDPAKVADEEEKQWAWLKRDLADAAARHPRHIIVFQHHPPFVKSADEANDYHNVPKVRRADMLAMYKWHNVRAVFAGHLHRREQTQWEGIDLIAVGPAGKPLSKDPSGIGQVRVLDDHIEYIYLPLTDPPTSQPTGR